MAERKYFNMKKDIHPDYRQVVFMDTDVYKRQRQGQVLL